MALRSAQPNGHKPAAPAPEQDQVRLDILPIPDARHVGLPTYDARDPDTTYPPITPLRRPRRSRWHGNDLAALRDSEVSRAAGSVEEPQFEFHRLVIQAGQAVVITAVAVE